MKEILYDFIAATEAAALACYPLIGRGDKEEADRAATNALRKQLKQLNMSGVVVIGEGELDMAPMLYIGERVGNGRGRNLDIAVDPLEGTNLVVSGCRNAITVIAAAPQGTLLHAPDMYMMKMAVGPRAAGKIDIDAPLIENMHAVAQANRKSISELTVLIQNRERHHGMIQTVLEAGSKLQLFDDGDVIFTHCKFTHTKPNVASCIISSLKYRISFQRRVVRRGQISRTSKQHRYMRGNSI